MGEDRTIRALGLDPSLTATGYAIGSTDGAKPVWGVFRSASWGDQEGRGLCRFYDFLEETHRSYQLDAIFYEMTFIAHQSGLESQRSKFLLEAAINMFGFRQKIDVKHVPLQSWRSRFLGTSKAPPHYRGNQSLSRQWFKEQAIAKCAERGWLVDDHNAAEALAICDYGLCSLSDHYVHRTAPLFRRAQSSHEVPA